jgi:hypothetical protein
VRRPCTHAYGEEMHYARDGQIMARENYVSDPRVYCEDVSVMSIFNLDPMSTFFQNSNVCQ